MYNEIMDEIKTSDLIGNHGKIINDLLENAKNVFKSNLVCVLLGGSCGKNNNIISWSDIDIYIILKEYDITMVQEFNLLADSYDIHVGITFYTLLEMEKKMIDSKTKVTLYEKELFHFNPTLYGYCSFPKIAYDEIVENDINNLPNVLHEVRRMYINILNKKTRIEKKYVKKMLLLLKCYLNTKHIFIYGYESVTLEFLKLYNKNCSTNEYSFDIIKVISDSEKYE